MLQKYQDFHNIAKCVYSGNEQILLTAKEDNTTDLFHHLKLKHLVEYDESQKSCVWRKHQANYIGASQLLRLSSQGEQQHQPLQQIPKNNMFTFKR